MACATPTVSSGAAAAVTICIPVSSVVR